MALAPFVVLVNDAISPIDAFTKAKIKFNTCVDRNAEGVGDIALKLTLKHDISFNKCDIAVGGVRVDYAFRQLGLPKEEYTLEGPALYLHVESRPSEYVFYGYSTPVNEVG